MLPDVLSFLLVSTRGFQKSLLVLFFIVAGAGGANAQSIHFLLDDKSENVYSLDEVQSIVLEKRQPLKIRFVERPELVYAIEEVPCRLTSIGLQYEYWQHRCRSRVCRTGIRDSWRLLHRQRFHQLHH